MGVAANGLDRAGAKWAVWLGVLLALMLVAAPAAGQETEGEPDAPTYPYPTHWVIEFLSRSVSS